jgi:hypothetical protein
MGQYVGSFPLYPVAGSLGYRAMAPSNPRNPPIFERRDSLCTSQQLTSPNRPFPSLNHRRHGHLATGTTTGGLSAGGVHLGYGRASHRRSRYVRVLKVDRRAPKRVRSFLGRTGARLGFPRLKPGDRWRLCAPHLAGSIRGRPSAARVLRATHQGTFAYCSFTDPRDPVRVPGVSRVTASPGSGLSSVSGHGW